jgi:Xaa-Pro aminopeptidase
MMFPPEVYQQRRSRLMNGAAPGLLLFMGSVDSPMNYLHNTYPFVQDSGFRYLFGLNRPALAGILDTRSQTVTLFGDDPGVDDIVWSGPQQALAQSAMAVGVSLTRPYSDLELVLRGALLAGVRVEYLKPYRAETVLELARLLGCTAEAVRNGTSTGLARAMIALREIKGPEEIAEIERALEVTAAMHMAAMRAARPGVFEREVVGEMEGIMRRQDLHLAYPTIFSRRGEVLHNHAHDQVLQQGDLVVNDTGVSADSGYASDITRTIPVGGKFNARQRALYEIVLGMQHSAIAAIKPGVSYVDVHKVAAQSMAARMTDLGFFNGSAERIVESGAYAIAFPHGIGHQMGLDVHDMESLGEDLVGYGDGNKRSQLFGLSALRMAKVLKSGMVLTVEPGVYFIPALIDAWQAENKFADLINYEKFQEFREFGGIRIEDNVVVTATACRILGTPIAKTVAEIEQVMAL